VASSQIISVEGLALVWASRLFQPRIPERVTGIDLIDDLLELAHQRGYRIFFFGAREQVVRRVVELVSARYSPAIVAGYRHGYYQDHEQPAIAREIAGSGAQMLLVGITSPKKERFLHGQAELLRTIPFQMGVGGSFDVMAGRIRRAPVWVQRIGLEWFFRWAQEPRTRLKSDLMYTLYFIPLYLAERLRQAAARPPPPAATRSPPRTPCRPSSSLASASTPAPFRTPPAGCWSWPWSRARGRR
jgi:N-acetylglucosaminyldiphosphoundecaprenol N-acetyl-beta-D-mannosaminyltransferase